MTEGDWLSDAVLQRLMVLETVELSDPDTVTDVEPLTVPLAHCVPEALPLTLCEPVTLGLGEGQGEAEGEEDRLGLGLPLGLPEGDRVGVVE